MKDRARLHRMPEDQAAKKSRGQPANLSTEISSVDGLSPKQASILHMQQQYGNAFVRRHLAMQAGDRVQRNVVIDEMTSRFNVRDEAKLDKTVKAEVKDALSKAATAPTSDDSDAQSDADMPADASPTDTGVSGTEASEEYMKSLDTWENDDETS